MSKNLESIMEDAIDKHWYALVAANDQLKATFKEIVQSVCPSLRFKAECAEDGLVINHEYDIIIDGCYVIPVGPGGARMMVELRNLSGQNQSSSYTPPRITVDHMALFDHLGLLED